jgi:hypothetical protein
MSKSCKRMPRGRRRSLVVLLLVAVGACEWGTEPRVATTLEKSAGDGQTEPVNTTVQTIPAVRVLDQDGKPLPDATVTFTVSEGRGAIGASTVLTDQLGVATPISWTLGTAAGANVLTASVEGLPAVTFHATGTPGSPARVTATAGPQEGIVSDAQVVSDVTQLPVVRVTDAFNNPVPAVSVAFQVTEGGGTVEPATVSTGPDGLARVSRWRLGPLVGPNSVIAAVDGLSLVTFSLRATPAAPRALVVAGGNNQAGTPGTALPVRPAAAVIDAYGNRVPGVTVTFVVTGGGGSVVDAVQQTDAEGVARVGSWTLGLSIGTNSLEANGQGLPPLRFEATGVSGSGGGGGGGGGGDQTFNIDLRIGSGLTASQQAIFQQAVSRWQAVITGDLPSVPVNVQAGSCGFTPALNETVDDVLIYARGITMDGVSGVLGRAGPCLIRSSGQLPALGYMEFDAADLAAMESNGMLLAVITHEIGHVLGIGTVWDLKGLLAGKGSSSPTFTGSNAIGAFDQVGGANYASGKVPVENTGGQGTRDAHWRETAMGRELMTGFMNNGSNPMSLVTIASLQDLGYQVDASKADTYSLAPSLQAPGADLPAVELIELPIPRPILVGPDGVMRPAPRD